MNKNTTFHLARHGQTEWNVEQRIQGQLDSALTPKGEQQARHLATLCLPLNITHILTSSLGRAVQTAKICADKMQLTHKILPDIEERSFGVWQGELTSDMQLQVNYTEITSKISNCKPEQGESSKQLLMRFERALKKQFQKAPDEHYLIITHGDILRCFMTQFKKSETSPTGYDYKNGHLISVCYNSTTGHFSLL